MFINIVAEVTRSHGVLFLAYEECSLKTACFAQWLKGLLVTVPVEPLSPPPYISDVSMGIEKCTVTKDIVRTSFGESNIAKLFEGTMRMDLSESRFDRAFFVIGNNSVDEDLCTILWECILYWRRRWGGVRF